MTVAELLERLSEFDPTLEVVSSVLYGGYRDVIDAECVDLLMNVN